MTKQIIFVIKKEISHIFLQICLGNPNDMLIIGTSKTYNDGKWHRLDANRVDNDGLLKIDNEPPLRQQISRGETSLRSIDYMSFGGNNQGIIQVTPVGFDGCLRQIMINRVNIDLSDNKDSIGVTNGCQVCKVI